MNTKEISELRRRFRADKHNFTHVHGCYVSEKKELLSQFTETLTLLPEDEEEKILNLLKKSMSGTLGKNLTDLTFATSQVVAGDQHRLLMALRESKLEDEGLLTTLYQNIAKSLNLDTSYLILLAYDTYDVPYRTRDDAELGEASSEVFRYFVCSICPVKQTRPSLGFHVHENRFLNIGTDWAVSGPEVGFLFPAFDNRATNIYNALYYTRNAAENHPDFVDAVFHTPILMPATEQRATFQAILSDSVGEDCSLEVVQAVQDQLTGLIEEHKEHKIPEPLVVSHRTIQGILESCQVSEEKRTNFGEKYAEAFGADTELSPANLVDPKKMELRTSEVTIQVPPEQSQLVQTKVIDGVKYIMVRVEQGVEVNGVDINITE
jgi:hypothetical protein